MEPTRPPSIRNIGKQHTLQVSSTPIHAFKPSDSRPISGSKRTVIEIVDDKSHSSAPNIRKKVNSYPENSNDDEATLMLKTKDQLLNICSRLDIYLPKSSNKSTVIEAIISHKSRNRSTDSRSISNNNTLPSSRQTILPTVQQEKEDYLQSKFYQSNNVLNDIGKALNGIETRLNSNLQSTSEKPNNYQSSSSVFHDELVAARATLCALKEHKEEDKKALKDHVEIFGQISEASTKPIMEAMRLFSQTTLAAFEKSATTTSSTSSQQITSPPPIQIVLPPPTSTNNMNTSVSLNEQQLLLHSLMMSKLSVSYVSIYIEFILSQCFILHYL